MQRCRLDFLSDAFAERRRFRILVVVDDFTRECLTVIADASLSDLWVNSRSSLLLARPAMWASDNGTELIGMVGPGLEPGDPDRAPLHRSWQPTRNLQRPPSRRAAL